MGETSLSLPEKISPEDVQQVVGQYLKGCEEKERIPTFSGLAAHLGMTRMQLKEYQSENPAIDNILLKARMSIEAFVEELLLAGKPPVGLVFWLKNNCDWIDKTHHVKEDYSMSDILDKIKKQKDVPKDNIIQAELIEEEEEEYVEETGPEDD